MRAPTIHVGSAVGLSYFARDDSARSGPAATTRCAKARLAVVLRVALAHWCPMTVTSAARALAVTLKQASARRARSECSLSAKAGQGSRFWDAPSIGGLAKVPPVPTFANKSQIAWPRTLRNRCLTANEIRMAVHQPLHRVLAKTGDQPVHFVGFTR